MAPDVIYDRLLPRCYDADVSSPGVAAAPVLLSLRVFHLQPTPNAQNSNIPENKAHIIKTKPCIKFELYFRYSTKPKKIAYPNLNVNSN